MTTITLKNIPDELYEQLKKSAVQHRRSVNSEILFWLERVLSAPKVDVTATIARAKILREEAAVYVTSNYEIDTFKNEGRP